MTPAVLLLAGIYDFSADLVALSLHKLGVPFLRLNRERMAETRITLDPVGLTGRVVVGDTTFTLTPDLRSVWFRAPVFLRNLPAEPIPPQIQLERSQWMALIRGLTMFGDALWVNHPRETFHAESKLLQLSIAAQAGLRVPPTLISNDVDSLRAAYPDRFALKPLDTVLLRDGSDDMFAYMSSVRADGLDEGLASAPVIAQQLIEDKVDVRVTVIGDRLSAVKVLAHESGIADDWRRTPKAELSYVDVTLPDDVDAACRRLVADLGLSYGAIDLAETRDGHFFLEINPTGEFGWLVSNARPYDAMIAELLAAGSRPSTTGTGRC